MQVNRNINFKAGLTSQMRNEIRASDVNKISRYLSNNGIVNDFKENKIIAWCSLKCFEIIKKLKLGFPKGIFVEDFNLLNVSNKNSAGLMNNAPTKLYLNQDVIIPEKTIFFNEFRVLNHKNGNEFWDNIDQFSDELHDSNISVTDFFLETFLHEFAHAAHEENLINKLNGSLLINILQKCLSKENIHIFQTKYKDIFSNICEYASINPIEAVACDLSRRIIEATDKNALKPRNNGFKSGPYRSPSLFYRPKDILTRKLHNYWNGKLLE